MTCCKIRFGRIVWWFIPESRDAAQFTLCCPALILLAIAILACLLGGLVTSQDTAPVTVGMEPFRIETAAVVAPSTQRTEDEVEYEAVQQDDPGREAAVATVEATEATTATLEDGHVDGSGRDATGSAMSEVKDPIDAVPLDPVAEEGPVAALTEADPHRPENPSDGASLRAPTGPEDAAGEVVPLPIIQRLIDLPYVPERSLRKMLADLGVKVRWNDGAVHTVDLSDASESIGGQSRSIEGSFIAIPTVFETEFLPRLLTKLGFNPSGGFRYALSDRLKASLDAVAAEYFAARGIDPSRVRRVNYAVVRTAASWKLRVTSVELADELKEMKRNDAKEDEK